MNSLIILLVVAAVVFAIMWKTGQLVRLSNYIAETREEMKKCTWPTWGELKGSTIVVIISIAVLGGFTVLVDLFFTMLVRTIN